MTDDELAAIHARAEAATPGPWAWRGNTDNQSDVYLVGRRRDMPGWAEVLGTVPVKRTADDRDVDLALDSVQDNSAKERARLAELWVEDPWTGEVREDRHLCLLSEVGFLQPISELAVYEVARAQGLPDDTPRDHPRVYRGDVVDVRHPDAQFIAHARTDLDALLAEVRRLRADLELARAAGFREGAAGALEAALHEVDSDDAADLLAHRADQWRAEDLAELAARLRDAPVRRRVETLTPAAQYL